MRSLIADGSYREYPTAAKWVGHVVAEVLSLDIDDDADKAKVKSIIKTWIANDVLRVEERPDETRQLRSFVVPGGVIPGSEHG